MSKIRIIGTTLYSKTTDFRFLALENYLSTEDKLSGAEFLRVARRGSPGIYGSQIFEYTLVARPDGVWLADQVAWPYQLHLKERDPFCSNDWSRYYVPPTVS